MTSSDFDFLVAHTVHPRDLAFGYDQVIRSLLASPLWSDGPVTQRRVLWTDADSARRVDSSTFNLPGLYIWGAEERPVYIGKTGKSFRQRFCRYIWSERSQCNLAKEFAPTLIASGINGFPDEVRQWYAKGYGSSTVRLAGAVRFANEGLSKVWFALFPANRFADVRALEKALIPIANSWNVQSGIKPLLNIEGNRRL